MLTALNRKTLPAEIADRIREYIRAERLEAGQPLPPERELAEQLQVGRSSLREALKLLQAWGWVEIRPQQGAMVAAPNLRPLQEMVWQRLLQERASLREIWEMRRLLEVGVLRWVILRATAADWERLEEAVQEMEAAVERDGLGLDADVAFHERLVDAAHNQVFVGLQQMADYFFQEIQRLSLAEGADVRRRAVEEHRQILTALRAGDLPRAEALQSEHLEGVVARGVVPAALPKEAPTA